MYKTILFAGAVVMLAGCKPIAKSNRFNLSGQVSGYKDSTRIYLKNDGITDSTYIIAGKFQFSDTLDRDAKRVMIQIKDSPDYKFFWVEPAEMTFKAAKGSFREAVISGSKIQLQDDELQATLKPLRKATAEAKDDAAYKAAEAKIFNGYGKFIEKNPGSIIGAEFLSSMSPSVGREKAKQMYNMLTPEMKNTPQGKTTLKFLSLNKDIQIGKPFVDFTQYDPDGKPVKLSDFKGHVILLDFWASWCGPCRRQNPELINTYNVYKNNGFKIVAVSVDEKKADWLEAVKKDATPFINVSEKNGGENTVNIIYGIDKYPSNYLIDTNGIIIAQDLRGEELGKALMKVYHINGH
ncbi:MAG: AhpC/TSA family protein [Bacteroidota bacterium]